MQAQPSPPLWAVVRGVAAVGSGQEGVNPERQLLEHEERLFEPEELQLSEPGELVLAEGTGT